MINHDQPKGTNQSGIAADHAERQLARRRNHGLRDTRDPRTPCGQRPETEMPAAALARKIEDQRSDAAMPGCALIVQRENSAGAGQGKVAISAPGRSQESPA